jgi:hypothetical protein
VKSRNLTVAKVVGLRTKNGCWAGSGVTVGAEYSADLNTIRQGTVHSGGGINDITYSGQFIDIDRDGNGRFWPWPTELLKFKKPAVAKPKKDLATPGELFRV